jgi:DNA helicase II / ATP-dependent DNA helicase PcrA
MPNIKERLLEKLTPNQAEAVKSVSRRILVVAGAGSGKTEVMARRIAWWGGRRRRPEGKRRGLHIH